MSDDGAPYRNEAEYDDEYDWIGVDGLDAGHVLIQPREDNVNRVSLWDAKNRREARITLTDEQLNDLRNALDSLFN